MPISKVDTDTARQKLNLSRSRGIHRAQVNAPSPLVYWLEHILVHATLRTDPIVGKILERRTGFDPVIRIPHLWIIDVPTGQTFPLLHCCTSFCVNARQLF
jgi:hypothetical protein